MLHAVVGDHDVPVLEPDSSVHGLAAVHLHELLQESGSAGNLYFPVSKSSEHIIFVARTGMRGDAGTGENGWRLGRIPNGPS